MKSENDLCKENLGLVHKIARSFYPHSSDLDDYVQIGMLGLLKAIRNHNPEKGKLTTLAHRCITNELIRYTSKVRITTEELTDCKDYSCKKLIDIFDGITDEEKNIILLKLESGYSFQDISNLLKLPKYYIKEKYKKAINKIKK